MNDLLTPEQLGKRWNKTPAALAQLRYLGTGPRFVRVSARTIRYRLADVEAYEQAQTFQRTDTRVGAA